MNGSIRLGFGIAVLFAAGVFAVSIFGKHDDWFLRAARANAVRCLTKMPCTRIDAKGATVNDAPPPLSPASACAKPENWQDAKAVTGGKPVFAVICRDGGKTYLYHLGRFEGGGEEQWLVCATPGCVRETARLTAP
jgi:hypothetical protein